VNRFDSLTPAPDGASSPSGADLLDFAMIDPDAPPRGPPLALESFTSPFPERVERINASIVVVLTVLCTVLSVFDLFLLASGS
jgi:hypothetical protein